MTIPAPIGTEPLDTDEKVLRHLRELVEAAYRRQLWLLLLDDDHRPIPLLPRIDIPERPGADDPPDFTDRLSDIAELAGASELVVVYERPGREKLGDADRAWLKMLTPTEKPRVPIRGPVLAHQHGLRWLGAEDLG